MDDPLQPKALERHLLYHSNWVSLYRDKVQFPNGLIVEQHHMLDFENQAVMAVGRDAAGCYVMVKVARYPTGRAEWEFPAGHIEPGEEIIQAGMREMLEETGYRSTQHELLYTYNPMNGIANQVFHVVRCRTAERAGEYDANEISAVRWFTGDEIWGMIRAGEIKDGYTLVGFLLDQGI